LESVFRIAEADYQTLQVSTNLLGGCEPWTKFASQIGAVYLSSEAPKKATLNFALDCQRVFLESGTPSCIRAGMRLFGRAAKRFEKDRFEALIQLLSFPNHHVNGLASKSVSDILTKNIQVASALTEKYLARIEVSPESRSFPVLGRLLLVLYERLSPNRPGSPAWSRP
jgi:hypothetical protein